MALKLGRRPPNYAAPRLWAEDYYDVNQIPAPKPIVDYSSEVYTWPMYLNDQIGDCTCAGICHCINAWTKYASGVEDVLPDSVPLNLYEAVGHYVPGQPQTDQGCVLSDILAYAKNTGVPPGTKILGYAQLKNTSPHGLNVALQLFGSVYLGLNLPQSAETQFSNNEVWSYVKGSPILGGHCVVLQNINTHLAVGDYGVVTWGAFQRATINFMHTYLEEAWVILSPQWLTSKGSTITGLDVAQLQADMALL